MGNFGRFGGLGFSGAEGQGRIERLKAWGLGLRVLGFRGLGLRVWG